MKKFNPWKWAALSLALLAAIPLAWASYSGNGPFNVAQIGSVPTTTTMQNAATANGNGTALTTTGMSGAILTVNCSGCSGGTAVNFEGSQDGTNYSLLNATTLGTNTIANSTTTAGVTVWQVSVVGLTNIRARISAYSAGTVTVTGATVPMTPEAKITNANVVSNTLPPLGTSGGMTPLKLNALSTTVTSVKSSAGQLFMLQCGNVNTSEEYVQIFNVASGSVTLGTTAPTLSVPIAATATGGFAFSMIGVQFSTAISVAATTTATGSTAPSTALDCNVTYN